MKVLLVAGLTGRVVGWMHTTTRHLVSAINSLGGQVGFLNDILVPTDPPMDFFQLDYPPKEKAEAQVRAAVEAFEPDLIHVTCGGYTLLNAVDRVTRNHSRQIRWIFTAHNIAPAERQFSHFYGHNHAYYQARNMLAFPSTLAWKRLLRGGRFEQLIVHSQTVAGLAAGGGCPREKICRIPFGADFPEARVDPAANPKADSPFSAGDYPKILCVAAMIHHKGQHDLIRAAAKLRSEFPKLRLVLIGGRRDRKYESFLEGLIRELNLTQNVSLAVKAPDSVLAAAWADADVYVQPSHEEGFCFAFLEGLMAVPRAIGTTAGAMPEMIGADPFAMLIQPGKAEVVASSLRSLLAKAVPPGELDRRRQRLRQAFAWETYELEHRRLYERLSVR